MKIIEMVELLGEDGDGRHISDIGWVVVAVTTKIQMTITEMVEQLGDGDEGVIVMRLMLRRKTTLICSFFHYYLFDPLQKFKSNQCRPA